MNVDRRSALREQVYAVPLGDGNSLLYAPLKQVAFVANRPLVDAISEALAGRVPPHPLLQSLQELGFFQPESEPVDPGRDGAPAYDTCVLFLTNQCNLRCTYCYAESGEREPRRMSPGLARAAISQVIGHLEGRTGTPLTLAFHGGGEPTRNWDVLREAVLFAREQASRTGRELRVCGAFNGVWSFHELDFIRSHFTELSISVDGIPAVQDRQRPSAAGGPTSDRVARTLHALDDAGFPYGIRMTVTASGLERLPESVEHLCHSFRPRAIQAEPLFPMGRGARDPGERVDPSAFLEQFIRAEAVAEDEGIRLFFSGARPESISSRFCLAPLRALVVTPEGWVTTCFEVFESNHPNGYRFLVGSLSETGELRIDAAKLEARIRDNVENRPDCAGCFCRWHCAGDCAAGPWAGRDSARDRCLITQELTKHLLLKRIQAEPEGRIWIGRPSALHRPPCSPGSPHE